MQSSYLICDRSSKKPVERHGEPYEVELGSFVVKAPELHIQEQAVGGH